MSRRFLYTLSATILPSAMLMVLVLFWLGLSFRDTSLFYYYFQMNVYNPPDSSINIFVGIACSIPLLACAYLLSNFIVKRLTNSIHLLIRIENIWAFTKHIFVPLFLYIACFTILELIVVLSIDMFHHVLLAFSHNVFHVITVMLLSSFSRFIALCTLTALCNSITLLTRIEASSSIFLIIYGFGFLIAPFLRSMPLSHFLPWMLFIQRGGTTDYVNMSLNVLLLIAFIALINWHMGNHDFLEAS